MLFFAFEACIVRKEAKVYKVWAYNKYLIYDLTLPHYGWGQNEKEKVREITSFNLEKLKVKQKFLLL